MKTLVGLSSPFSLVTISFGAIGALSFGSVDFGMAAIQCFVSLVFFLAGGIMMERMGDSALKLSVGIVLIMVGFSVAIRTTMASFWLEPQPNYAYRMVVEATSEVGAGRRG
eukprot:CAMPEP_0183562490 /NCGR_PEP_ID=MMETSP0371-20130417/97826_1 /TAXON_ID=268820 /ORGANISM="Peridinium aciculiferum, Strain PAER-2" /LENGTH=110 /DNA_ID=CAMNT_0025771197 /DNA_START=46 /DNA_END=376 /DNA_ORIENTATION=-